MARRSRALVAVLLVALALAPLPARAADPLRPGDVVPGAYIVTLRDGVAPDAVARAYGRGADVRAERTYSRALRGLAVRATRAGVARLRADGRVAAVEPDRVVGVAPTTGGAIPERSVPQPSRPQSSIPPSSTPPSSTPWGLDRIDQRALPLDGAYGPNGDGAGVTVYVLDTGIRPHDDLAGRLAAGVTAIPDGRGTDDCNGHGTHVAGTVAGRTLGAAPAATVVPVRVLDCEGEGTWSQVIAGIDWVARTASGPSVLNLSLGGEPSVAVDSAVRAAIDAGVTTAVAAGNESSDACGSSPARVGAAITVGATGVDDRRAWFSNHGACLDVFAPGAGVRSAGIATSAATATLSGTSMASPHVAGVAAIHLAGDPDATPAEVGAALAGAATTGVVGGAGAGSVDALLYTAAAAPPKAEPGPEPEPAPAPDPAPAPQQPGNTAPTARAAAHCHRDRCTFDAAGSGDADGTVASVRWSFSDGTSAPGTRVTATPSGSGTFSGTVTVTDDDGATASATATVRCRSRGRLLMCS